MKKRQEIQFTTLMVQRTMLIASLVSVGLYILLNRIHSVFGSSELKNVLTEIVTIVLGASVVGLLWEITVRRAFAGEMRQQFSELLESVVRQTSLGLVGEREGLISITRDFHHGIPWGTHIANAREIDLCWWAGNTWIEQNLVELRKRAQEGMKLRLILPDISRSDVIDQMIKDSGMSSSTLTQATFDAVDLLSTLSKDCVSVRYSDRVPRYMLLRLGNIVVFSTYPLTPGKNSERPNVICTLSGPIGSAAAMEFGELFESSSEK